MRVKLLSLFAAGLLLAACGTSGEDTGAATGGGQTGSSQTTTTEIPGPQPGSQEDLTVSVGDRVFFDFDKYNLKSPARQTVERLAAWMQNYPAVTLTIEGHADERGTREYNLALGERRANSVRDYLISLGINPNRLSTVSYGEEQPAVLGSNEEAWAQNRRAVFAVN
jgi:peptidoglycan-associated lipoprotein